MPNEEPHLTPAERELAEAMSRLKIARAGVDPLAVAFDAGRSSARRAVLKWKTAAAVLLLGLAGALMLPLRPVPATVIVKIDPQLVAAGDTQLASYYSIRNDVLARGVSALPEYAPRRGAAAPLRAGGSL
jgi:hypothetical protein